MEWETVIGLEVHVQLATKTKIFSGASTAFGAEPNTQACAIDLAMPGTLPSPNAKAFEYAIMFGLAVNAEIGKRSVFERKNYFYPDSPKGYQTTQLEQPIVGAGYIDIELDDGSTKRIRIHHAHLEEDAGKSLHEDFHDMTGIDLNRAGTPLIEVVTEPDISNKAEAVAFARKLHAIVTSLGIGDGDMSQGSMRFDVNISVRLKGQELGTRTETKNLNSFRFMERCIDQEVQRQIEVLEDGGKITQETRLYNGDTHTARPMRSKEEANDYRYFPCPDLLPVEITDEYIQSLRDKLPELPDARKARFIEQYGLSDYDAGLLGSDANTAHYFEACAKACDDAKLSANWVAGELAARLNNEEIAIQNSPVNAELLAGLIARIKDQTISNKIAKQVFEAMWQGEGDADSVIEAKGLKQVSDSGALEKMVDDVMTANQQQVDAYRAAEPDKRKKMLGFFVGQIMKASKGQANPQQLNQILLSKLDS
ncbi:Asp-tRNA(Asn)/Glu-tRNA(Gln) amidotransferase subunit GatB [Saccharophagus degradans]|uniref:Aspartyl/glutamyl-tRNA(Asn/Gln) amidotransferase subunit B n=1 Tax=Saccharophagus degradans TaxID=86304 RepID=A0AAW7X1V2_9GAMM|nr:Asp-tRNA(Asn)/Glu-tRNA(Gln) amidotransferase subunit GatB [Saccharophagus degradans]MBU2985354.1 Asp-tRNA(Asn)/Glu-tRNA(Gln) amidotransferase subunit GatB [Saccharophagus degradans]MDO6421435.1 Asp-tRNA(Asn)/Glu-tRNA(Gln) amidotransferase subunit GatB [Saccharophagus degradans]MDO6608751.1 Asp-tRNA(Asn)/Glu-tRNA(Gln) amidotransferase subunit GatB [Saccharophagus degradans]